MHFSGGRISIFEQDEKDGISCGAAIEGSPRREPWEPVRGNWQAPGGATEKSSMRVLSPLRGSFSACFGVSKCGDETEVVFRSFLLDGFPGVCELFWEWARLFLVISSTNFVKRAKGLAPAAFTGPDEKIFHSLQVRGATSLQPRISDPGWDAKQPRSQRVCRRDGLNFSTRLGAGCDGGRGQVRAVPGDGGVK